MAFLELNWLGSNSILLFWTASGIVSHFLAFEALYQTEILPNRFGVEIMATVSFYKVLISKVINFFNMGGAMVSMVGMGVIFFMEVMLIMTIVVIVFMRVEPKMNMFIMWSVTFLL